MVVADREAVRFHSDFHALTRIPAYLPAIDFNGLFAPVYNGFQTVSAGAA